MKKFLSISVVILILLGLDFFSKLPFQDALFFKNKPVKDSIFIFNKGKVELSLTPTYNKGAAFGILANKQSFLIAIRVVIICALFIYLLSFLKSGVNIYPLPLIFIFSGALGNLLDFFLYGYVIDFIKVSYNEFYFPIFNLADIFITCGGILLFFPFFKKL